MKLEKLKKFENACYELFSFLKEKFLQYFLPDDNYLRPCHFLCIDIFKLKIIKLWTFQLTFFYVVLFSIQTYLFLYRFDTTYFIRYGPSYFLSLNFIFCILSSHFSSKIVAWIDEDLEMWKTDSSTIRRESVQINLIISANVIVVLINATLFVLAQEKDDEIHYQLAFFEEFFPGWKNCLSWWFRCQLWMVALTTVVSPSYHLVYGFNKMKFQLYILLDFIKELNTECPNDEETRKKILFCVKRHIEIYNTARKALKLGELLAFPFELIAVCMYISSTVLYFSFPGYLDNQYWRQVTFSAALVLNFAIVFHTGQEIQNVSSDILDALYDTAWYNWSTGNKKLYLMFILNASKTFQLKLSENYALNYNLGVQTMKSVFSTTLVIYQLNFQNLQGKDGA